MTDTVFDNAETAATEETTETQTVEDYVAELVGAEKKYKSVDDLAKGAFHAQKHIANLERQLEEMRQDMTKNDYASQLLERLKGASNSGEERTSESTQSTSEGESTSTRMSEEDLEALVNKTIEERESRRSAERNLSDADKKLREAHGANAPVVLRERAQELGMSVKDLQALAEKSPTAFFKVTGLDSKTEEPAPSNPKPAVNSDTFSTTNTNERDWNWYQNLRRKNKRLYFDPKTQRQMLQDEERLGARFGRR